MYGRGNVWGVCVENFFQLALKNLKKALSHSSVTATSYHTLVPFNKKKNTANPPKNMTIKTYKKKKRNKNKPSPLLDLILWYSSKRKK